ncbi:MAG: DUF4837 family protein [Bacteroidaceae bacterium]|nr:DUF4837 family protein [Bacteroidaceae bacterium]
MKKLFLKACLMLLALMIAVACGNNTQTPADQGSDDPESVLRSSSKQAKTKKSRKSRKKKSILVPHSTGSPYEVLLVAAEDDFHNGVVDSLYAVLNDDVRGVLQPEPSFKVSRITQNNLSKNLRLCRNIVMVKINPNMYSKCKFKYSRDVYAAPQIVMTIQAPNAKKCKNFILDNREAIKEFFTRAELNRQIEQLRDDYQPVIREKVMEMFGCEISAPVELNRIKTGRDFFWARAERFVKKVEQSMDIVVYSYPYRDKRTFTQEYFIRKRDSVMKANVPGPHDGQYMMTTRKSTFVSDETVHGKYAQVVRGLWNIRDYDMGGSFVSVSRVDEKYQRVIVAEGFVYYPNHPKRDVLRKLEAALYTLRLPDELDSGSFSYNLDDIIITPEE